MSQRVFIVSAKRTPIGSFLGGLSTLPAPQLGAQVIKSLLTETGLPADNVDECIMGNVLTAGVGQAPARQAALAAGLPTSVPCMTINKVCGSGLKAVMLASDSIKLGKAQVVIAGGQENMSASPHLLMGSRTGYRLGPINSLDSMVHDGLWDPYNNFHMGSAAEACVSEYKFTREEQDEFAANSYSQAQKSIADGVFKNEITPVEISTRKSTTTITEDEEPFKVKFEKISSLRPAFDKQGSITAANASTLNDGAAALMVVSEEALKKHNLTPLVEIISDATFAQDPKWFTTAPVSAMKKALSSAQLNVSDIDLWEINEAFSAVTMAAIKDLEIPKDKVNVFGGSVAIGHPIGASGARILTTLVHALETQNKKYGCASLCIGGGEAVAVVVKRGAL